MQSRLLLSALFLTLAVWSSAKKFNSVKFATKVNSIENGLWKATADNKFASMDVDDIRRMMRTKLVMQQNKIRRTLFVQREKSKKTVFAQTEQLPTSFDSRTKWSQCRGTIKDQGLCGGCFAVAASTVFAQRYCIGSPTNTKLVISAQNIINCDSQSTGCDGGFIDYAWEYMRTKGVVTEDCQPYKSAEGLAQQCSTGCAKGTPAPRR